MHLMIFDPHEQGHYLTYVRYLLLEAMVATRVTLVLRQGVTRSAPYRHQLDGRTGAAVVDPSIHPESFRDGRRLADDLAAACARHRPDHVWIPNADTLVGLTSVSAYLRRWKPGRHTEIEIGIVEARLQYPPTRWRGHIRQFVQRRLIGSSRWRAVHTIDPTFHEWAVRRGDALSHRVSLVPDPLDPWTPIGRAQARKTLGIPLDGRYVTSIGNHAVPRKGSNLLVDAFIRARLADGDRLLLVGALGEYLQRRLAAELAPLHTAGRIVVIDRYLSDTELMEVLSASDLVCTPYFDHVGSSGIALRAVQAGRPVLAPHQGWFAAMVPRFGLGATGRILDPEALAAALEYHLPRAIDFRVSARASRLITYSLAENFAKLWATRLRERLGRRASEAPLPWAWVLEQSDDA